MKASKGKFSNPSIITHGIGGVDTQGHPYEDKGPNLSAGDRFFEEKNCQKEKTTWGNVLEKT